MIKKRVSRRTPPKLFEQFQPGYSRNSQPVPGNTTFNPSYSEASLANIKIEIKHIYRSEHGVYTVNYASTPAYEGQAGSLIISKKDKFTGLIEDDIDAIERILKEHVASKLPKKS